MKSVAAIALALLPAIAFGSVTRARYLMGTICEITVADSPRAETQIDAAFAEAQRVENVLSTWRADSELSRLNREGGGRIDPELRELLETAADWSRRTGGAFNPLVRPLIDLWKTRGEGAVPGNNAIRAAISRTAIDNLRFEGNTVVLDHGAQIEEGAFGKGYAIDRMMGVLRGLGAKSALINFGGQLAAYGEPREVSIADPADRGRPMVPLTLGDESLSTSSGSERSFVIAGRQFTHIIDPRSGEALPPRGSVSVVHRSALVADILSTALYVMGPEEGARWAREQGIAATFITTHGRVMAITHER